MATTSITNPLSETDKPPCRQRPLPVSLRLFLTLLGLFCVGGAIWIGARIFRHQLAIRDVQKAHGVFKSETAPPEWLRGRVDDSWLTPFETIVEVSLPFSETLDANTAHLLALRPLPAVNIIGGPPIHDLIRAGRLDEVRSLLTRHPILLFSREMWRTPLHVAVCEGDFNIDQRAALVKFLLEQGAEIDGRALNLESRPLRLASHPRIVSLLLDHGANLAAGGPNDGVLADAASKFAESEGEEKRNWLEITRLLRAVGAEYDVVSACYLDDAARVRKLIKRRRPEHGQDALRAAARGGRIVIFKLLLEHGIDPNDAVLAQPVAHDAIKHPELLQLLFDKGTDPDAPYDRFGIGNWTLLHEAAKEGGVESARLVLSRGVSINARSSRGETPLHVAAVEGKPAVVRFLLDHQADPGAKTNDGLTAISLAAGLVKFRDLSKEPTLADRLKVVELLLAAGEPLDLFAAIALGRTAAVRRILAENPELANSRDYRGTSALNLAVKLGHVEIVVALLASGADVNDADRAEYSGHIPLLVAAEFGRVEIAENLIDHGANVNAAGIYGQTSSHLAAQQLEPAIVRLLLAAGAKRNAKDRNGRIPLDCARNAADRAKAAPERRNLEETIRLLDE